MKTSAFLQLHSLIATALLLSIIIPPHLASADEGIAAETEEVAEDLKQQVRFTRDRRGDAQYFGHVIYSPLDLIIPHKFGANIGFVSTADKTWELEYLKGSANLPFVLKNLGSMKDERISLTARSYFGGNSFNLSYGVAYNSFSLHLGDDIMNRVSGGSYPSIDLIRVSTLGAHFAVGNRWIFNHGISLGVDWFGWSQPLFTTEKKSAFLDYASNPNDYRNVDTAIRAMSYFPRWQVFKVQLGMVF